MKDLDSVQKTNNKEEEDLRDWEMIGGFRCGTPSIRRAMQEIKLSDASNASKTLDSTSETSTILKEGHEVSISGHEVKEKEIKKEARNCDIVYLSSKLPLSSEWYLTETPEKEGSDLVPTSDNLSSDGKDTKNSETTRRKPNPIE